MRAALASIVMMLAACGDSSPPVDRPDGGSDARAPDDARTDDSATPMSWLGVPSCGPATPGFSGPLCGPPDRPCRVVTDETIEATAHARSGRPAIAVDTTGAPHVLFSIAEAGFLGFHAERDDATSTWSVEPMPGPLATASIAIDGDEEIALVHDGTIPGTALFRRGGTGWSLVDELGSFETPGGASLQRSSDGCLHAGLVYEPTSHPAYGVRTPDGWSLARLPPEGGTGIPSWDAIGLALAPSGAPHLVYWLSTDELVTSLLWVTRDAEPEPIETIRGGGALLLEAPLVGAVDASGTTRVHVAYLRGTTGAPPEIVYATRAAAGSWTQVTIARGGGRSRSECGEPTAGALCSYDLTSLGAHALLTSSSGDVRIVYSVLRSAGMLEGDCATSPPDGGTGADAGPPPGCTWRVLDSVETNELRIAWPSSDAIESAVLLEGALYGTAALDASGRIHFAAYALAATDVAASTVRYVVIAGP